MESNIHQYLGTLVTPPEPGMFRIAYTPNIVNKAVVNKIERIVNGKRKDVTYTMDYNIEWVDYAKLAEVVTGHGWAIARPFDGEKNDTTINMISYVGLDFDGISQEDFDTIKEQPFVKGRGFFHYSASHGQKPGVSGHWICPLEQMAEISTESHRNAWRLILMEIVDSIKLGDRKVKDLQRLFYGAQGQSYEIWGSSAITIAELEAVYEVAVEKERLQMEKRAAAVTNSTKRRRTKDQFSYETALELTEQYVVPNLDNGSFPDVEFNDGSVMDSYEAWIGYFLGWKQELGLDAAAQLMQKFAPADRTSGGSKRKLASFDEGRTEGHVYTFGTTMKLLRHFGYKPTSPAFGQAAIKADVELAKRFLEFDDLNTDTKVTLVKSPKGTGKTALIEHIAASGLRVAVIGHRRALLRNTTGRTGIPNYQDVVPSEAHSICITIDSLHKLDLKRQAFDVIIIDEVEQVLQHCIGDTLKESRAAALSLFRILLKDADKIYCFDADLSFVSINFMKTLLGAKNVTVVENVWKLKDRTIQMYPSKIDIIRKTEEALARGEKVALATNSKKEADKAEEQMRTRFPEIKILSITQENSDDPDVQQFVQNINSRVQEVDLLIYSPSLGTGVSIDVEHFDFVHLIGVKDVTTHFDLDQMANRVRRIKSGMVRAFVGHLFPEEDPREGDVNRLKQLCIANAHETGIDLILQDDRTMGVAKYDQWYVDLWADINALRNQSMNNLDVCFVKLMEEQGHQVVPITSTQKENAAVKARNVEAGDVIEERRVTALVEAKLIDSVEYAELTRVDFLPFEEKRMVEKYEMHEFYQQEITPELVVRDDRGRFRDTVILLEMVTGKQNAEYYDETEMSVKAGLFEMESRVMIPHRKFYGSKKKLLNEFFERAGLGRLDQGSLEAWGKQDVWYSNKSLCDNGFVEWLGQDDTKERIERLLEVKIRSNYADQASLLVGQMLRKLGFDINERRSRVRKSKATVREYSVSEYSVTEMARLLETREAQYKQELAADSLMTAIRLEYEQNGCMVSTVFEPHQIVSLAGNGSANEQG
jgi:hypothetical protein